MEVEIDLILKGIKTNQLKPIRHCTVVEIDLILKGIKTQREPMNHTKGRRVEIDLILKGIKTVFVLLRSTAVERRNRPDSQRD